MKFIISLMIAVILVSMAAHASPPPPPNPFIRDIGNGMTFHFTPYGYEEKGYLPTGVYIDSELVYAINEPFFLYGGGQHWTFFSSDGMTFLEVPLLLHPHGVFLGLGGDLNPYGSAAVRVFYHGNVVNYYTIPCLVNDRSSLRVSASHVWWDDSDLRYHDVENNTLQLTTLEGRTITFDITAGEIINIQERTPWLLVLGVTIIAFAFFSILAKIAIVTSGVFRAYLAGTKGALLLELLFVVPLAIFVAWGGSLFFSVAMSIAGFAIISIASLNTCFEKYFSIMPIKAWAALLAEYFFFLVFMAAGTALAIVCVIIAGGNLIFSLNTILFVLGYTVTVFGFVAMFWPIIKTWVIFLTLVPIAQMYLVLGVSRTHDIFSAAVSATPVVETNIFSNTPIWLAFIAVSLVIFVGSYFATLKIERNY